MLWVFSVAQNIAWIFYALGAFVMFGITNFLLKYASVKGVPSIEGTVLLWLGTGCVGIIAVLLMVVTGMLNPLKNPRLANMDFKYFAITIIAGVTLALGMYFLKVAIGLGKAGPATAVALSNAVLVAVLAWIFLGESLTISELIGMVLFIAAIIVFAFKPLG